MTEMPKPKPENAESAVHVVEAQALLERILAAVEKPKRPHWIALVRAIVLSLAALGSAWSAYQASRWNGVAGGSGANATILARRAVEQRLRALQFKSFDGLMAIHWLEARQGGQEPLAEFLRARFSPALKPAADAWLKLGPFTNPAAPATPFLMAEYVLPDLKEAESNEAAGQLAAADASTASRTGDSYVLLTFLFGTVLFLGGLAASLPSRMLQNVFSIVALSVYVTTFARLLMLPVAPWR